MTKQPGLGRRHAADDRDREFPMALAFAEPAAPPARRVRWWNDTAVWLDQGATSMCVGYSWCHWLADGPVTQRIRVAPKWVYDRAQALDEWDGTDYDGTTVRAGAKALTERGAIGSYLWAWDADTVVRAILDVGPVVVGTNWYNSMFDPAASGQLTVDPSSGVAGGHAYLLNGASLDTGRVRVKNSWGRGWGRNGRAWMTIPDLNHLIAEQGEACLAVEERLVA